MSVGKTPIVPRGQSKCLGHGTFVFFFWHLRHANLFKGRRRRGGRCTKGCIRGRVFLDLNEDKTSETLCSRSPLLQSPFGDGETRGPWCSMVGDRVLARTLCGSRAGRHGQRQGADQGRLSSFRAEIEADCE